MSQLDELFASIPIQDLAQQVGADEAETEQAVRQVLPALVGGLQLNAQQPEGEQSLASALADHSDSSLGEGRLQLNQVDTSDGEKIVGHVFGDNTDAVVNRLGGQGGSALVQKLLPILAPIVLAWLSKKLGGGAASGGGTTAGSGGLGGALEDLLGSVLGGSAPQKNSGGGLGGLDDLLGSILGGGR